VDPFTHALSIGIILYIASKADLMVWGVIGGIILDIDVFFLPFSDPYPSLYIFSHGGITHSLVGAALISVGAFILFRRILSGTFVQDRLLVRFPVIQKYIPRKTPSYALFAVMAGAFLHLGLDCCAFPGLPLLYPLSLQKFTLGMLSGSSMIMLAASLLFVLFLVSGRITFRHLKLYVILFIMVLLFSAGVKLYVSSVSSGRTIPTLNPFSWLIIEENETSYLIEEYRVFEGITNQSIFEKYRDISPAEADPYMLFPETRRLRYFSYLIVVEKNSSAIMFHDPLREDQIIWYPPYYTTVEYPNRPL
jgi:inner membrane protein